MLVIAYLLQLMNQKGFCGGSVVKSSNAGAAGLIPGSRRSPGEGNAIYPSILVWVIPWTEEPHRLQSMGLQKSQT